jgi:hypothetical protein
MDDIRGAEATGGERVVRVDGSQFLNPESALVRTALDLLATHRLEGADIDGPAVDVAEGEAGQCAHCGLRYPCPTAQHARQVVNAGGLALSAEVAGTDDGHVVPDDRIGAL